MAFRFLPLFFVLFSFPYTSHSQKSIEGKVIDSITREPVAFAMIIFNNNHNMVALADIDGRFSYKAGIELKNITVTHIGYENQKIDIIENKGEIFIELIPTRNELKEILLITRENPANRIIRKTIANKTLNNPENLNSFSYYSYNKTIFEAKNKDSLKLFRDSHLFIMESVTKRKYKKPSLSEEIILGTRVSGFKNPKFAVLATEFQPFSFYDDIIKLYDISYVNPISKGSLKRYEYQLKDTIFQAKDSVYVISYKPKDRKNFQGLEGLLYINTNQYAVQNVTASPMEKGKINIAIRQQYKFVNNQHWFPKQLNYELIFEGSTKKGDEIIVEGKSYIDSIQFDIPMERKDFSLKSLRLAKNANRQAPDFWENHRRETLDSLELRTYKLVDSLGQKYHFDRFLDIVSGLMEMKVSLGPVDIDLSKTFIYNNYEGFRLGTGIYTNEKIAKDFTFGGFFGYGLKDNDWKYGGEIIWHPHDRFSLWAKYANDLTETGFYGKKTRNILNPRQYIASQFDNTQSYSLGLNYQFSRSLSAKISFHQKKTTPKYPYEFHYGNFVFTEYHDSKIKLALRFAYGEKATEVFGQIIREPNNKYPILDFSYTRGLEDVLQGNFTYNKIDLGVTQHFYTRGFGSTHYKIKAGLVDRAIPYGLLFTGQGSYDNDFPLIMKGYFQTMYPYEFLSNRYANLFLSHNFGTLLFKTKTFQPHILVHQNIGWGELEHREAHHLVGFKTMEKFFLESGLQIDNILKINYLDIGYLGFGIAGFYRYGPYALPSFEDNLALKATVGFTIK